MRRLLRVALAVLVFVATAYPCARLELLCRREIYHGLEATGIITRGPNLWGQILGRNIPQHPEWMERAIRAIATLGVVPALFIAFGIYAWLSGRPALNIAHRWRRFAVGFALAWVPYAVVISACERPVSRLVQSGAFELGKALGVGYFQSSALLVGPNGPFMSGPWANTCNFLWSTGPWMAISILAFLPALAIVHLIAIRGRVDASGCLMCGYDLRGLRTDTCPECGAAKGRPISK